jgi:hypothetical protein
LYGNLPDKYTETSSREQIGTFHGKGTSAVFALEEALRDVSARLKSQPKER